MKITLIFKYIFIIFVIGIISYAGYKIYTTNNKEENNITIASEDQVDINRDLRLGISSYDSINPLITSNKEVLNIDSLIFEPLFYLNEDYTLSSCLATEWSKTGDNIYVVKIDTTIKWQDGSYLTAKDIQFTIDKLKEGNSIYKTNVDHVTSVEVVDASTIKIFVDEEEPFFEYNLTFPIMSYLNYYEEDFFSTSKTPIGTGRFQITSIGSNTIVLSKYGGWRNIDKDESKIDTVKINLYSSMGEVFNSFKLGNLDLITTSTLNYEDYIGTIGFNVKEVIGREFDFLSFNCQDSILQDKYVRQAINYAIDKDAITTSIFNNKKITANYPIDYGNYYYQVNTNSSGYNQEQAKKILQDNGWEYKNNRWKKYDDGVTKTLQLKISVNNDDSERIQVAENIKEQLENIGIRVTVDKISNLKYQDYLKNQDYQMIITGIYNSISPNLTYFFGEGNVSNYQNDELISLVKNSNSISTKNLKTLKENYEKIRKIYEEEVSFVGLYRNKSIILTSQELQGDIKANFYNSFYSINELYRR